MPSAEGALAWLHDASGLVGWGEAARLEVRGPGRFVEAREWWREAAASYDVDDEVRTYGSGPIAFGSFAFAEEEPSVFVVPRVVLGRDADTTWLTTIGGLTKRDVSEPVRRPTLLRQTPGQVSVSAFKGSVSRALASIGSGEFDKVVLAHDLLVVAETNIDPRFLIRGLSTSNPGCWCYSIEGLVGATPELLIRRRGAHVLSRVVAGTTSRGVTAHDDGERVDALVRSPKERDEHRYAVDSLVESLSPHVENLVLPTAPSVLRLSHVTHLATEVAAQVSDHAHVLDLVAALHPTAAVGGSPRKSSLAALGELEDMNRGRYAGPVGWVDAHGNGEWGIALRCAQLEGSTARLFAGCGIVTGSDPDSEAAEAQAKFAPVLDAFADAPAP